MTVGHLPFINSDQEKLNESILYGKVYLKKWSYNQYIFFKPIFNYINLNKDIIHLHNIKRIYYKNLIFSNLKT